MNKMTQEQLNDIVYKHSLWISNIPHGVRAIIREASLDGLTLEDCNLSGAIFIDSTIVNCKMINIQLYKTGFYDCGIYNSKLKYIDLNCTKIIDSRINEVEAERIKMRKTEIIDTNIYDCNLNFISIMNGNDIIDCEILDNKITSNDKREIVPLACPEKGSFIGFKKARTNPILGDYCIVELEIPADAKRSSATTRKCRCDKAKVLSIAKIDNGEFISEAYSVYDPTFIYKVGEMICSHGIDAKYVSSIDDCVQNFDSNRWNECSTGIHFFMSKNEAERYAYY